MSSCAEESWEKRRLATAMEVDKIIMSFVSRVEKEKVGCLVNVELNG